MSNDINNDNTKKTVDELIYEHRKSESRYLFLIIKYSLWVLGLALMGYAILTIWPYTFANFN